MIEQRKCIGTISYMGGVMSLPEPFCWAWSQMRDFSRDALCGPNEYIHASRAEVSLHDSARNHLADTMRGEWLLMLDTDLDFDPDLCARLVRILNRYDLDVLTGVYCFKRPPYTPVVYYWNEESERTEIIGQFDEDFELTEVGAAGGGCLLIRRRVFEKIKALTGERPFDRMPAPNWKGATHGEDHSFFHRLRQCGIKAYCPPRVHAYHLRYEGVDPDRRPLVPVMATRTTGGGGRELAEFPN